MLYFKIFPSWGAMNFSRFIVGKSSVFAKTSAAMDFFICTVGISQDPKVLSDILARAGFFAGPSITKVL